MRIVMIAQTDPNKYNDIETIHAVATAALKKGHEVRIFLYDESVVAANKDTETIADKTTSEMMKELVGRGVELTTCGACCILRGMAKEALVEGSQMGGLPDLANMASWADRILNFSN